MSESFSFDFKNRLPIKIRNGNELAGHVSIFGRVFAEREGFLVLEIGWEIGHKNKGGCWAPGANGVPRCRADNKKTSPLRVQAVSRLGGGVTYIMVIAIDA